jgi:hypothetical protein
VNAACVTQARSETIVARIHHGLLLVAVLCQINHALLIPPGICDRTKFAAVMASRLVRRLAFRELEAVVPGLARVEVAVGNSSAIPGTTATR